MKIGRVAGFALVGACLTVGGAAADEFDDGSFAMPQEVVSAATAFQTYMASAAHVDSGFVSGDGVERGLKAGAAYEPAQLEEGMIAYGAIAALQDDGFVQGVQDAAGHGDQRSAFAERLIEDPDAATRVDGADEAGARVEAALGAEAAPLVSTGSQVKTAAYTRAALGLVEGDGGRRQRPAGGSEDPVPGPRRPERSRQPGDDAGAGRRRSQRRGRPSAGAASPRWRPRRWRWPPSRSWAMPRAPTATASRRC